MGIPYTICVSHISHIRYRTYGNSSRETRGRSILQDNNKKGTKDYGRKKCRRKGESTHTRPKDRKGFNFKAHWGP